MKSVCKYTTQPIIWYNSNMQQCSKIFGIDENYHSYVFLKNKITQVVVSVWNIGKHRNNTYKQIYNII